MLTRDLTAAVIKTFFEELDGIRDGNRTVHGESPYSGVYDSYFAKDRVWFMRADIKEITLFFADDPVYKLEMLVELMYRDARKVADAEIQAAMYRKIIALYDVIDARSRNFSLERMGRAAELKRNPLLQPGPAGE